jgi:nitrogen fixation/metabolism regulation signal transduction histidine kinase
MDKDLEHLKLLGIFHYIWGALSILGGLATGVYVLIMGFVFFTAPSNSSEDAGSQTVAGGVIIAVGIVLLLVIVVYGILVLLAGGKYRKHQGGYWFCFALAIITLVVGGIPGIVLGIFSLVVLSRATVKALFKGESLPGTPGTPLVTPPIS